MKLDLKHHFPEYIPVNLDIGCGQRARPDFVSIDMNPELADMDIIIANVDDKEVRESLPVNHFEYVECVGCLNEFATDVVTMMNWFWELLKDGGILKIALAVTDKGRGAFRDPLARHYLDSDWIEYFYKGGNWQDSGSRFGLGFRGNFDLVSNDFMGERQTVVFRATK